MTFLLNFTYLSEDFDTLAKNQWSKQSYLVTSRRRYYYDDTTMTCCFADHYSHRSIDEHVCCRFFQFWLNFQDQSWQWRSIKYDFNRYWHHTRQEWDVMIKQLKSAPTAYILFKYWGFGEKHLLKALQCQQCNKTIVNRVEPISTEKEAFFLSYFFLSLYRWDVCQKKTWPCSGHFRRRRSNKRTPQKHHIKCLIVIWPGSCTWQPIRNEIHLALWQSHKKSFQ